MALFQMTDAAWRRHANVWSVYTRFAAIPLMIVAIWSRVWLGWWALVPIALVIVWLILNPHAFPEVTTPTRWAEKGIYGERIWLREYHRLPAAYRTALRWIMLPGAAGILLLAWGLIVLSIWPTIFGAVLLTLGQLWRIDRLSQLYDLLQPSP